MHDIFGNQSWKVQPEGGCLDAVSLRMSIVIQTAILKAVLVSENQ
jgi:hypothetical protein